MVLREGQRIVVGAGGIEPAIDIAGEGADRGALLGLGEALEALMVQRREIGRDMHQIGKPCRPKLRRGAGEATGVGREPGLRGDLGKRRISIERLGRREKDQHMRPR